MTAAEEQARQAMSYNGNGPECLPHLECGGCGCHACIGGARRCGGCIHRVAVTTVEDGTPEGMDLCGWCDEEGKAAQAEQEAQGNQEGQGVTAPRRDLYPSHPQSLV